MLSEAYIDALQVHRTPNLALTDAGGLLSEPEPRSSVSSRPRRNGSIVRASFYEGRVLDLAGIARGETPEEALATVEALKLVTRLGVTHTFRFRALGRPELEEELELVFVGKLELGVLSLRSFSWAVQAVASDPRRYSSTLSTAEYDPAAAGGSARGLVFPLTFPLTFAGEAATNLAVSPGGDFPTPPVLTIFGPVSNPVVDNDSTGESIYTAGLELAAGETAVLDVAVPELLVGAGGGGNGPTYPEIILATDALAAYWRMDDADATEATEERGLYPGAWAGSAPTAFRTPGAIADAPSYAVELGNGNARFLVDDSLDELNFTDLAPFTLEAWLRYDAAPDTVQRRIFSHELTDAFGRQGYYLAASSTAVQFARYQDGGAGNGNTLTAPWSPITGSWYHLAAVFDGATMLVYLDGQVIGSSVPSPAKSLAGQEADLTIGYRSDLGQNPLHGSLDELAIYSRALSSTELSEHHTRGLLGQVVDPGFSGGSRPDLIDAKRTTWFDLRPDENLLRLRGDGMVSGETRLKVEWRDARL